MAAKAIVMGRVGQDPEVRWVTGANGDFCTARYSIAVARPTKGDSQITDWIQIKALGKTAEFVEKYVHKGMKMYVEGALQVDNWEKDGKKYNAMYVLAEKHEFCESKASAGQTVSAPDPQTDRDGFMNIDPGIDEELPFV